MIHLLFSWPYTEDRYRNARLASVVNGVYAPYDVPKVCLNQVRKGEEAYINGHQVPVNPTTQLIDYFKPLSSSLDSIIILDDCEGTIITDLDVKALKPNVHIIAGRNHGGISNSVIPHWAQKVTLPQCKTVSDSLFADEALRSTALYIYWRQDEIRRSQEHDSNR